MTNAPERFYMCSEGQLYEELAKVDTVETYIRAELHAELIKAADELAEHVEAVAEWMRANGHDDAADIAALAAYRKAKE